MASYGYSNFIYKDENNPKKNVLVFIHGLIGSEESWLGTNDEVRIPEHLYSTKYIRDNYDFALFSYYSKITSFFDNTYTVGRRFISGIPKVGKFVNSLIDLFIDKKVEFKTNLPITEISELLRTEAITYLKDYDRIIFIAHSMGGLVAKSYIIDTLEKANSQDPRNQTANKNARLMASKISGYISIAVPHNGADLATLGKQIFNNAQVTDLASLENFIYDLTNKWIFAKNLPLTAYFRVKSDGIVDKNSSKGYDIRNIETYDFTYDHFTVLKPDIGDPIIQTLIDTIIGFETDEPKQYYYDLINYFIGTRDDGEVALKAFVVDHTNEDFRSKKFLELKKKAKSSLTIMGVGITNIQESEIEGYLDKGTAVRLLMMNPNILLEHFNFGINIDSESNVNDYLSAFDMMLKNNHIDDFYQRTKYNGNLIAKFESLRAFVQKVKPKYNSDPEKGSIEMLIFNSFIPLSFTSINTFADVEKEKEGVEEFIVEFALPYSEKRIHIPISKQSDLKVFEAFIKSIEQLRQKSVPAEIITLNKIFQNG